MTALIDAGKCKGCGRCLNICPIEAIILVNGKAVIKTSCIECGACGTVCRNNAICLPTPRAIPESDEGFFRRQVVTGRKRGYRGQCREPGKDSVRYCICSNCGEKLIHRKGIPCNLMNCPKCGSPMGRGFARRIRVIG